ncbi:MAG: tetratricopeptide repeat protein [Hydrococcus sp. C42_A2020_068]|nr:tetratricopeptide repeat protein [Hydrococcus sp. C42_A2020_068]
MSRRSRSDIPIFNLLSIGHRGVGKTVFLAGSYTELLANRQKEGSQFWWLECRDSQGKENIEGILEYVARTGQYPPPTMKITDFNFALKHRQRQEEKTSCYFRWWDVPGESCNLQNPDFQKMVLSSHGCCVFFNGKALVHNPRYLETIEEPIKQIVAIASLVNQHGLDYPFALIFTQCDLLEPGPISQLQIEANLQPLLARLDAVNAKYQRFYSAIPIVSNQGQYRLKAVGASASIVWLLSELNKTHQFQGQIPLESGLKRSVPANKRTSAASSRKFVPLLLMSSLGLLGVSAALFFAVNRAFDPAQTPEQQLTQQYERILEKDPANFAALTNLADLYIQQKQLDKAIPVLEKIVEQPTKSFDLHFILADIYAAKGDKDREEKVYDRVLAQQANNFDALIKKAVLRVERGDEATAKTLFAKAENIAPTEDLKAQVRSLAQRALK